MTATGHALVGTLIAAKFSNPALAVPLTFFSHFVTDMIPHWDTGTDRHKKSRKRLIVESAFDVIFSLFISFLLLRFVFSGTNLLYGFLIVFISQLPDWFVAPYYFFKVNFAPFRLAYLFQKNLNHDLVLPWGILTQILVVVGLYIVLFKLL